MQKAAALLRERVEAGLRPHHRASRGCRKKDSIYEVGRVCDVLTFSAIEALKDDGQVVLVRPDARTARTAACTRSASRCWA